MTDDEKKHIIHILTTPPNLETTLHTPLRSNMSLCLPTLTPTTTPVPNTLECGEILSCYKEHKVAARLTIKYTDRTHYNKYGTALLAMFIKELVDTLKSIPKTSLACNKHQKDKTPNSLSYIRDLDTGQIKSDPAQVMLQ